MGKNIQLLCKRLHNRKMFLKMHALYLKLFESYLCGKNCDGMDVSESSKVHTHGCCAK